MIELYVSLETNTYSKSSLETQGKSVKYIQI